MKNYFNKHLHIVSFDVPAPPDYGGVIDVFYKIKALHHIGIKIHLHCFQYGRVADDSLLQYCETVQYYTRKTGWKGISLILPYMLYSRRDPQLLHNLQTSEAPILLEGVHSTYYLNHPKLKGRKILLRNQNIEADYFKQLQYRTRSFLKKWYYKIESVLLHKVEQNLHRADAFLTVAQSDHEYFKKLYPNHTHAYIPSFTPVYDINTLPKGKGNYILYHGNLGHPENHEAAVFIIKEIASQLPGYQFIFAGKSPQKELQQLCNAYSNIQLKANPSQPAMDTLISNAHIHLLLTFQATGLKLKLLAAIQKGRFVIANKAMVKGSNLDVACAIADTPDAIVQHITTLMQQDFDEAAIAARATILKKHYALEHNALKIAQLAFG